MEKETAYKLIKKLRYNHLFGETGQKIIKQSTMYLIEDVLKIKDDLPNKISTSSFRRNGFISVLSYFNDDLFDIVNNVYPDEYCILDFKHYKINLENKEHIIKSIEGIIKKRHLDNIFELKEIDFENTKTLYILIHYNYDIEALIKDYIKFKEVGN